MNTANNNHEIDPLAQTMRIRIGEFNLPSPARSTGANQIAHCRKVDPLTIRTSLPETNVPTERHRLYALIFEKADVMLQRAGGTDLLTRLMLLPSGATLAALAVGAILRTLKLPPLTGSRKGIPS